MTEADYHNRMERLQRFIPFLENMIDQLKDPKMKNREQQSLYGMITDKKKKLKIETLMKCEEVIVKLYQKVKGEHAHLPSSLYKTERRKSVDIYTMAGESLNKPQNSNNFSFPNEPEKPKGFFLRKPPISYEDLEVLEKDVASELERKMSLQELNSLRNELCQQLQENDTPKINTTVRSKPVLTKLNSAPTEKNRKQQENNSVEDKIYTNDKKNPTPSTSKKLDDVKHTAAATPKVLKESVDIFDNAFSEIDKSYEIEAKKREERRSSTSKDKKDKEEIIAEKIAHVRHLAEKAAELRSKPLPHRHSEIHCGSKEIQEAKVKQSPDSVSILKPENVVSNKEVAENKSSGKIISEEDVSQLAERVNKIKEALIKNEKSQNDISRDKLDKMKLHKESADDHCISEKNDHKKNDSDHKVNHKSDRKKDEKRHDKDKKDRDKNSSGKESEKVTKDSKNEKKHEGAVETNSKTVEKTENANKARNEPIGTDNGTTKIDIEANLSKPQEVPKEIKHVNRDPRLKYSASATNAPHAPNREISNRLAYKYNPKPKRPDAEFEVEKNVADSIEKSMKESNVPLPPKPRLEAPPPPPDDLFSPQSPDELDRAPVPAILNDILLNPNTTGVINEVVSALQRSNNEKKLMLPLVSSGQMFSHEMDSFGMSKDASNAASKQPLFSQFRQTANLGFSPPSHTFSAPSVDCQGFIQPKPVPPPLMSIVQPRGFNPFITPMDKSNACEEMPVLDFQPPGNVVSNFERPANPPHLTPYEDRMGQPGFPLDRGLNFVAPSSGYVPPSPSYTATSNFVPPSPNYVPPSPVYDGNNDNFRDVNINSFHNFSSDRSGQSQGFFEKDRGRSQGLLGDFPQMPYNSQYGNQNYDTFYNNQTNFVEPRKPFHGGAIRDPRMNRGNKFCNEFRMGRDSRMTYREYKEQKERENRERESREREIRDREARERELLERQRKEKEETVSREKEDKCASGRQKEERDKNCRDTDEDRKGRSRNRSRERSRDRYSRNRSSTRYGRDRSKERLRLGESRFDKAYSSRDKDKEDFTSPLDSLYTSSKAKTGKGYGVQFKIPKLVKEEEKPTKDDKKFQKGKEKLTDDNQEKDIIGPESHGTNEEIKETTEEENRKTKLTTEENQGLEKVDCNIKSDIDIKDAKNDNLSINEDKEIKNNPVIEITHQSENTNTEPIIEGAENIVNHTDKTEDNKISENSGKKEEEESILSKFFQNLMKSSNKDEKKGALLSLISTFSDSFSDQQLKRITNIIRSEENTEIDETVDKKEKEEHSRIDTVDEMNVDETATDSITEKNENPELNLNDEKLIEDNSVQVSVGERIKSRKRAEPPKTDSKTKIRSKTELDRLHEDIREMFIRDGVVTATGKRMCRILKDNIESDKIEQNTSEELKKKAPVVKKRGRKAKKSLDVEMRELSVILPKMSFENMKDSSENNDKRYSLRKPAKATNYNENDVEETKNKELKKPDVLDEIEESSDGLEEEEVEGKDHNEGDASVEGQKKLKPKKKIRKSWAAGVIRKKSGGKTKKAKSPPTDDSSQKNEESPRKMLYEEQPLYLHDKEYYYRPDITSLPCKVCEFSTKWIAAHYRSEHPDIEVLSSRLSPDVAQKAIEDAIVNREEYEADIEISNEKHQYTCRFCDYSQKTLPRMYRDHVSIHTGEFRHRCPYCNYRRSHIKSMQTHVNEIHANEVGKSKRRIISQMAVNNRNIYGYICEECNYTQMSLQNVQHHVKVYHSGNKLKIYKIKMNINNPLKHIDRVERKFEREFNSLTLNIGPIKVLKSGDISFYSCCSPPCIFSSRDQKIFENHCRSDHNWNENAEKFPNCLECNAKIECSENNPLLLSALDHARNDHSTFLGIKYGSIRVSSNLFPENKKDMWDKTEVSSETTMIQPSTINISPPNEEGSTDDSIVSSEVLPQTFEDENPFSFKIVDVVSLAEHDIPPLSIIDNQIKSGNIDNELIVPETNLVSLSPNKKSTEKMTSSIARVPNHVRKSANALKKFLNAPNDLFKCPEFTCLFTTNKRKMFDIHIRIHPNQSVKSLCCLYCDKFLVLEAMGDHFEQVHGMCRFACYYCLYRCIAKDYMDIHQLLVHSDFPPRMRVLPYRDAVDKNVISILSEAAKNNTVPSYTSDKIRVEDYPAFVPTNKRFQCCAVGCNYLCLEEANLRHHLTALHMEDLNFVCVHCKTDLSDAADVDTILKHLKLHELHLYMCSVCKFIHNLRHKVERHIGEKHKNKECSVVVLGAMDSEPFDENQQVLAPFPVAMNQKSMKLWRCCMCKYRCYTQNEAEMHVKNKHDIDCRYKCALCTFKSNVVTEFTEHFKTDHPDNNVDVILAYHKDDDPNEAAAEMDQFDTTPLWLRDKPRVRHIRGILFDENLPAKKKTTNLKTQVTDLHGSINFTGSLSPKKRKRSESTIAETYAYNEEAEEEVQLKKEAEEATGNTVEKSDNDVIIIEDDVEQQDTLNQPVGQSDQLLVSDGFLDDVDLICTLGDVGIPVNKNFKCPKCDNFQSTKMKDFIQHVSNEIRYHRFECSVCEKKFFTIDAIKTHCIVHHDGLMKNIVTLPTDPSVKRWLTILLEKQIGIIRSLGFQTEDMPNDIGEYLNYEQSTSVQKPHMSVKRTSTEDFGHTSELKKPRVMVRSNLIAKDKYACCLCHREFDSVPEMEFHGKEFHNGEITYEVHTTELPMTYDYGRERKKERNREYQRAWRQRKKDLKPKDSKEEKEEEKRKRHRENQRAYYQRKKKLKENDENGTILRSKRNWMISK